MPCDLLPRAMEVVSHKVDEIQVPAGGVGTGVGVRTGIGWVLVSSPPSLGRDLWSEVGVAGSPSSVGSTPQPFTLTPGAIFIL